MPEAIDVEQSARDLDALVADLHKCQSPKTTAFQADYEIPVYPSIELSGTTLQKPKDKASSPLHPVYRLLLFQLVIQGDYN